MEFLSVTLNFLFYRKNQFQVASQTFQYCRLFHCSASFWAHRRISASSYLRWTETVVEIKRLQLKPKKTTKKAPTSYASANINRSMVHRKLAIQSTISTQRELRIILLTYISLRVTENKSLLLLIPRRKPPQRLILPKKVVLSCQSNSPTLPFVPQLRWFICLHTIEMALWKIRHLWKRSRKPQFLNSENTVKE